MSIESVRSPHRIMSGILAELRIRANAHAAAVTTTLGQRTLYESVNTGYSLAVVNYLSSHDVQSQADFLRAVSTVSRPQFWVDLPHFSQTEIVQRILRPSGYAEGTSIALGANSGMLHVSFERPIAETERALVAEYARRCDELIADLVETVDVRLSPRESMVLSLVAEGATNSDIAKRLHIAGRTVATHIEHVLVKTNTRTRTQAAVKAARLGLIEPVRISDCR